MPGVVHVVFGLGLGLFFWKFSIGSNEKRRWTFGLVLVFAINNYFGPDLRGALKRIAKLIQSDILYIFAASIHTFLWWPLFSIFLALLWFAILSVLEKNHALKIKTRLNSDQVEYHNYSYADVYIAILTGGLCHLFVDLIGHPIKIDEGYFVYGSIPLFTYIKLEIIIGYLFLIVFTIFLIIIYGISRLKLNSKELLKKSKDALISKNATKVYFFLGIALLNVLIISAIIVGTGNITIQSQKLPWNDNLYEDFFYDLGTLYYATKLYEAGTAEWYLAIWLVGFIIIAIVAYARDIRISIRGKPVRLDFLAAIIFIIGIILGYLIQPIIGNISRGEVDLGVLIFLWSTLGMILIGALSINPRTRKLET